MEIIIAADIVPTESNCAEFQSGNIENVIDINLLSILNKADFRILNLEVPLADKETPIPKCGPNLIAPIKTITGIKKLNPILTLANNHIMDQGEQGLYSTVKALKENNIPYVGVGNNLDEAQKPYIIEKDGIKAGIYACAEHEFSIADEEKPGANPFDALESFDHISKLKEECDFVVVLYHGGKEHYRYPSPNLQKVCRKMVEKGADLILCQHSHCIGCEEKYLQGTILYGQGNFLFDKADNEFWKTSLIVKISIENDISVSYIPLCKNKNGVRLADEVEKESILNSFYNRSAEIKENGFIKKAYSDFANKMINVYLQKICGVSFGYRVINKLCGDKLVYKISQKRKLAIQNYIECEAHRELLLEGMKDEPAIGNGNNYNI